MKRQLSRVLAVLLSTAMVLSLAACGQKADSSAAAGTTAAAAAAETTAAAAADASEATEASGVNKSGLEPGALPIVPAGTDVTLTIGVRQNALTEDYENNEYTKWLEEQTGVNLDFVYFSFDQDEAQQQLSLMVAGNEKLPDIMVRCAGRNESVVNEYGEDGYYIDLTPYYEAGLAYYWEQVADFADSHTSGMKANLLACQMDPTDGKRYAWAWAETSDGSDNVANHAWLNTAWLEKLNLEFPKTIGDLENVLTHFVNDDPNGNGKKDEMGIATIIDLNCYRTDIFEFLINAYVFVNDNYLFNSTDGKIWLPYTTDEYREALKTLNRWYENGLISPVCFTLKENSEMKPIFTPADGVPICGLAGGHAVLIAESNSEVFFDYDHMWPLEGETSVGGYANWMAHNQVFDTAISSTCENPEVAFRFLDFLSSKEAMIHCRYGTEGRDWEYCDPAAGLKTTSGKDALLTILDETVYSTQNNINWHSVNPGIMDYCYIPESFEDDGSYASRKSIRQTEVVARTEEGKRNPEQVFNLAYTAEEQDVIAEYKQLYYDYVRSARSQFISGEMDIDDNAAWEAYKTACNQQGQEELIGAAQGAWDRMNGK